MSFADNSTITNNRDAWVFNQMYQDQADVLFGRNSWLYNQFRGKPGQPNPTDKFILSNNVESRKLEVTVLGTARTMTVVADSAQYDTISLTPATGTTAMVFDYAHVKDWLPIGEAEYDTIKGAGLKGAPLIDRYFQIAMESVERTVSTAMHATGSGVAPSATAIGSWVAAVSDGTSSGESNYTTYGLIDRSASGNSDFQGNVTTSVGNLTLDKIGNAMTGVITKRGRPKVGVAGQTVYNRLRGLVEGFTDAVIDGEVMDFSGAYVRYAGCLFGLDADCPAQTLGILDPATWVLKRLEIPLTREGVVHDPSRKATYVLHYGGWYSLICVAARKNWKLTGITG